MRRSPLDVMKCERGRDHVMADLGPPHAEGRTLQDSCEKHVCLCVCVCVCVCVLVARGVGSGVWAHVGGQDTCSSMASLIHQSVSTLRGTKLPG